MNKKNIIVEKPFTGYFGDGTETFNGDTFPRKEGLKPAMESIGRMLDAEKASKGSIMYAENWVYAPAVQKEREIISTNLQESPKSWRLPVAKNQTPTSQPCKCLILRVGPVGHDPMTP